MKLKNNRKVRRKNLSLWKKPRRINLRIKSQQEAKRKKNLKQNLKKNPRIKSPQEVKRKKNLKKNLRKRKQQKVKRKKNLKQLNRFNLNHLHLSLNQ
jgi:hypothetical protein